MAKLIMLIGLPGSGKSTYSKNYEGEAVVVSSDEIRVELFRDINYQGRNQEVFNLVKRRIRNGLKNGKDVIWDSTNLNRKHRIAALKNFKKSL